MNYLQSGLELLFPQDNNNNQLEQKLLTYIKELELFNSAYDLTNATNTNEIIINHLLDSLSAKNILQSLAQSTDIKIADIGSGGGLPGIPLALSMPNHNFTLVERMSKRCAFLENCSAILGLKNVTVENLEAERVPPESYDIIVFRAFRPLDKKMFKTLNRMVKPNGYILAYKAKKDKIEEEMNGIKNLIPMYEVKQLFVPFLTDNPDNPHERNLVIIKKEMA